MSRQAAEKRGRRAEQLAALLLMAKGWRIVARRRRMPMIEVDLVARRGAMLAVVEVKRRATLDAAVCALTPWAAEAGPGVSARVDLIALAPGRWPRHIPGVG